MKIKTIESMVSNAEDDGLESSDKMKCGRKKSKIFLFDKTSPLPQTHCQVLTRLQPTLVVNGHAPKPPLPHPEQPESEDPAVIHAHE